MTRILSGLWTISRLRILIMDPGLRIRDYGSGIMDPELRIRDYGSGNTDTDYRLRNMDRNKFGYDKLKMDQ